MISNPTISQLLPLFKKQSKIAVMTGAGISAESGVPTFRDKQTGLWSKFNPQVLANFETFLQEPKLVWDWYDFRKKTIHEISPNPGHFALAELGKLFPDFTLITQNIDNLHQKAGSENVVELHGSIERNYCISCRKFKEIVEELPPKCDFCGGLVRPDVVWFGEMLPEDALRFAFQKSKESDIFLCIGTSAVVYPAAQLPVEAARNGSKLIIINPEETEISPFAAFHVFEKSGEYLPALVRALKEKLNEK